MKKQKLARLLSLFLMVALLTGVLLATSAGAEVVAPPEKSADSSLGPSNMDASLFADPGQSMADASDDKAIGVFMLAAGKNSEDGYVFTAFYCTDGSNAFIASNSSVDAVIKDGYNKLTLAGLKGNISASYLGADQQFAYFSADGLKDYTPFEIGSSPVDEVSYLYLGFDNNKKRNLYNGEVNLSTCQTEDGAFFVTDIAVDSYSHIGMPVVSKDNKLVGETYYNGEHMAIFRFAGTDFKFAAEYALSETSGLSMDKITLGLIIGAAAVAAFLFWKNKGKKQPQQQAAQGSIPLDSGSVNAGAGFDKTKKQTDSAADGQDIYGPTVPNPSKVPLPAVPVQERKTVPVAQWQVRCVKGPLSGRVYPLSGKLTFGRSSQCDVKFPQDVPGVSATHCQVSVRDDKVYLQDMGSSYGTYYPQNNLLNARTDYPLHSGEIFTLAQDVASFRLEKMGAVAENDGFTIKDVNGRVYRSDAAMRLTLGRNPGCQGNFGDGEASVSGRHCVLYREEGKLYLMDLDSTNGTFFSQQERLKPNVPYRIRKGMAFFLTTPKYTFVVTEE